MITSIGGYENLLITSVNENWAENVGIYMKRDDEFNLHRLPPKPSVFAFGGELMPEHIPGFRKKYEETWRLPVAIKNEPIKIAYKQRYMTGYLLDMTIMENVGGVATFNFNFLVESEDIPTFKVTRQPESTLDIESHSLVESRGKKAYLWLVEDKETLEKKNETDYSSTEALKQKVDKIKSIKSKIEEFILIGVQRTYKNKYLLTNGSDGDFSIQVTGSEPAIYSITILFRKYDDAGKELGDEQNFRNRFSGMMGKEMIFSYAGNMIKGYGVTLGKTLTVNNNVRANFTMVVSSEKSVDFPKPKEKKNNEES